jgi:hypothetical protein
MGLFVLVMAGVLVGAAGIGIVGVKRYRSKNAGTEKSSNPKQLEESFRTIHELRLNDVILLDDTSYIVGEVRILTEGGRRWAEAPMTDGDSDSWISLAEGETVMVGRKVTDLSLGDIPPAALDYDGQIYQLKRHGQAKQICQSSGDKQNEKVDDSSTIDYWQYARSGDERLSVRRTAQRADGTSTRETEIFVGKMIANYLVEWLPGS